MINQVIRVGMGKIFATPTSTMHPSWCGCVRSKLRSIYGTGLNRDFKNGAI